MPWLGPSVHPVLSSRARALGTGPDGHSTGQQAEVPGRTRGPHCPLASGSHWQSRDKGPGSRGGPRRSARLGACLPGCSESGLPGTVGDLGPASGRHSGAAHGVGRSSRNWGGSRGLCPGCAAVRPATRRASHPGRTSPGGLCSPSLMGREEAAARAGARRPSAGTAGSRSRARTRWVLPVRPWEPRQGAPLHAPMWLGCGPDPASPGPVRCDLGPPLALSGYLDSSQTPVTGRPSLVHTCSQLPLKVRGENAASQ